MPPAKQYLLDANVFIESHKNHYAFDLAPGFWESLIKQHSKSTIYSIDAIRDELTAQKDALSKWTTTDLPRTCFLAKDSPDVLSEYGKMQTWAYSQPQYTAAAKSEFATNADCWLIAYAKAKSYTLVTHEKFDANIKRKIPIPNVCRTFGVECIDTFAMLRALGVKLVLG